MCIVVIALQQHPLYPFILASNRDEFRSRPCRPADWWKDDDFVINHKSDDNKRSSNSNSTTILAGMDLKECGTWLGMTKSGRIAGITNHRDMKNKKERDDAVSRGRLVVQYLTDDDDDKMPPNDFVARLLEPNESSRYNGFNLLVGKLSSSNLDLHWCCNVDVGDSTTTTEQQKQQLHEKLEPGIHVISNAYLNTPWPKSKKLKDHLEKFLNSAIVTNDKDNDDDDDDNDDSSNHHPNLQDFISGLFQMLQDSEPAKEEDDELPDTGIGLEWERILSSIFVNTPIYGTVSSTVIVMDTNHYVRWEEKSYDALGAVSLSVMHEFSIVES